MKIVTYDGNPTSAEFQRLDSGTYRIFCDYIMVQFEDENAAKDFLLRCLDLLENNIGDEDK